jgi:hypothetical protein
VRSLQSAQFAEFGGGQSPGVGVILHPKFSRGVLHPKFLVEPQLAASLADGRVT